MKQILYIGVIIVLILLARHFMGKVEDFPPVDTEEGELEEGEREEELEEEECENNNGEEVK
ncbi:hypothetical protein M2138_000535 [Dysgonomonadaceae bacterium PH5-43]|nr:hypothetical protein [Dysgonomonadaceae bacterium PH5-43]